MEPLTKENLRKYFEHLDSLRESGVTNMLAAPAFLRHAFRIDAPTSHKVFGLWSDTFNDTALDQRVEAAVAAEPLSFVEGP